MEILNNINVKYPSDFREPRITKLYKTDIRKHKNGVRVRRSNETFFNIY